MRRAAGDRRLAQRPPRGLLGRDGIDGIDGVILITVVRCVSLGAFNLGASFCKNSYTWTGTDQLVATINATVPKIAAAIDGIRQRAPQARIPGYPAILPDNGTTRPWVATVTNAAAPFHLDAARERAAADPGLAAAG
ncbi:hypothetical protein J7E93_29135 [Streptomyces sp. ISL-36]|uniref:hypothetical protein n=1 Tax=Streptomyces sp. ISL-36 TaxID=2819182 RepID=UPI001BE57EF5|nr:hypothetical protein [Streptomyces sp. ISL-36]MBT2444084.1 hypothetical protein [Streptomyces sp. ISL-36]